jgi:hypothetical protein
LEPKPKTALVVTESRNIKRLLARSLTPAGWELTYCAFSEQAPAAGLADEPTMCVLDADGPTEALHALLDRLYSSHQEIICLLLAHDTNSPFIRDLINTRPLNNLIAKQGGISSIAKQGGAAERIDETELIVTCQKLYERDIFGLEKYISTWGVEIHDREVTSSADKRTAIRELRGYLDALDTFQSIRDAVIWVADELLMNAMFNAPRDGEGNAKYVDHDRSNLQLEPHEEVSFRYCCNGRFIAVSAADRFGSIDREVMLRYINRCLATQVEIEEQREAGAGLGLYIIFNSITQLAFNIEVGISTEVVALFYVRAGPRAFNESGKSLNIFLLQ